MYLRDVSLIPTWVFLSRRLLHVYYNFIRTLFQRFTFVSFCFVREKIRSSIAAVESCSQRNMDMCRVPLSGKPRWTVLNIHEYVPGTKSVERQPMAFQHSRHYYANVTCRGRRSPLAVRSPNGHGENPRLRPGSRQQISILQYNKIAICGGHVKNPVNNIVRSQI